MRIRPRWMREVTMTKAIHCSDHSSLERIFTRIDAMDMAENELKIAGYASLFGRRDKGGDTVQKGAYAASLARLAAKGERVKMLWQHDPGQPIGVWDVLREDARGLYVEGRILTDLQQGREVMALIEAGAIDGLSIGYRTVKATPDGAGGRLLTELDLWEVSLVTFPMLPEARLRAEAKAGAPGTEVHILLDIAEALQAAREAMARGA